MSEPTQDYRVVVLCSRCVVCAVLGDTGGYFTAGDLFRDDANPQPAYVCIDQTYVLPDGWRVFGHRIVCPEHAVTMDEGGGVMAWHEWSKERLVAEVDRLTRELDYEREVVRAANRDCTEAEDRTRVTEEAMVRACQQLEKEPLKGPKQVTRALMTLEAALGRCSVPLPGGGSHG